MQAHLSRALGQCSLGFVIQSGGAWVSGRLLIGGRSLIASLEAVGAYNSHAPLGGSNNTGYWCRVPINITTDSLRMLCTNVCSCSCSRLVHVTDRLLLLK